MRPPHHASSWRTASRWLCSPSRTRTATRVARPGQAVRALGYDNACGVADLWSTEADDLFALPRLTVTSTYDGDTLVSLLEQGNRSRDRAQSAVRSRFSYALRRAGVKKRESAAYSRGLT